MTIAFWKGHSVARYVRSFARIAHSAHSLAPFTGSLTHSAHSLVGRLKFMNLCSRWNRVSREQTRFLSSLETHPMFILVFRTANLGGFQGENFNNNYSFWNFKLNWKDVVVFIKTRPDTRQSSRGRLGRSSNAKTARNSKMWRKDGWTDLPTYRPTEQHGKVFWYLSEHANTRKHVNEYSCSSVRVFLSILAHLAYLAQYF